MSKPANWSLHSPKVGETSAMEDGSTFEVTAEHAAAVEEWREQNRVEQQEIRAWHSDRGQRASAAWPWHWARLVLEGAPDDVAEGFKSLAANSD